MVSKTHFTASNITYAVKCLIGVAICYTFYVAWPQYPFNWALVSVVLAISPDNSSRLAINRIIANLLGCSVGLCMYPVHLPYLLLLCSGVAIIITTGLFFKITDTLRSALASFLIVMLQEEKIRHWYLPLERVLCVMTGCIVALLLTLLFNLFLKKQKN